MKLLVLAQTPPPLHGQSLMVQTMVDGLPAYGIALHHLNLRLSRDTGDIGRWRTGKAWATFVIAIRALHARFTHGCNTLYYVPAPAKRGALYRDWLVLLICRPAFRFLVLHWHAAGLGEWLLHHAHPIERCISRLLLGRAHLAIVLGEGLRKDAAALDPRRIAVVRNGIADPCPGFTRVAVTNREHFKAIFVGLCSREKGVLATAAAVLEANRADKTSVRQPVQLIVAGDFPDEATSREFHALANASSGAVRHAGFITGREKYELFARADVLVFPTFYPHETQGLVVAEALAFDLPVITTRWRAVHEGLPARHVYYVEPDRPDQIADALAAAQGAGPPLGALRAQFLAQLTREHHLAALAAALRSLQSSPAIPAELSQSSVGLQKK